MIATRRKTRWGLPKGAVAANETQEAAAIREVSEETGLDASIIHLVDTIEYFFRAGDTLIHKYVDFYLMAYRGGSIRPQLEEVDDAAWVELDEAIARASFESERKVLEGVRDYWAKLSPEERQQFAGG